MRKRFVKSVLEKLMPQQPPHFDRHYYLANYPDVAAAGVDPLTHYVSHGWREGRNPSVSFHTLYYIDKYMRSNVSLNPLEHYALHNKASNPLTTFPKSDEEFLDAQKKAISKYFDEYFYRSEYNLDSRTNALDHYLRVGWRQGFSPAPQFSTSEYLSAHPHVLVSNVCPLYQHVVTRNLGVPTPAVGAQQATAELTPTKIISLANIDARGVIATISGEFDPELYLRENPDVRAAKLRPLLHYINYGWNEGRNPNGLFWTAYYLSQNEDVRSSSVNPFYHYIVHGRGEGRKPNPIGLSFWPRRGATSGRMESRQAGQGCAGCAARRDYARVQGLFRNACRDLCGPDKCTRSTVQLACHQ